MMVMDLLPSGLRGLVLASFLAAFMSTLSTYLNLSSAYFVNDFYAPFVSRGRTQKHYVLVSRVMTLVLSVLTAIVTYFANDIEGVFKFLIAFGSGTGLVYIMRWFWWRVNAWSELSAIAVSTATASYMFTVDEPFVIRLAVIIAVSTVAWLAVTFLTRPVEKEKLVEFVRRVRPSGPGWSCIRQAAGGGPELSGEPMAGALTEWVAGSAFVVGLTLGIGKLILGFPIGAAVWLVLAFASLLVLLIRFRYR